jgi:hypothetical protein
MLSLARFIPAWANPASPSHELVEGPIVQTILVSRVCDCCGGSLMSARSLGHG